MMMASKAGASCQVMAHNVGDDLGLVGVIFDVVRSSFRQRDQFDLRVRTLGGQQRVVDARVERVGADGVDI